MLLEDFYSKRGGDGPPLHGLIMEGKSHTAEEENVGRLMLNHWMVFVAFIGCNRLGAK